MTPIELRRQADSLTQRGLYRRARDAAVKRAKRAAAKAAAVIPTSKPGDAMRAAAQRANRIKAAKRCHA